MCLVEYGVSLLPKNHNVPNNVFLVFASNDTKQISYRRAILLQTNDQLSLGSSSNPSF